MPLWSCNWCSRSGAGNPGWARASCGCCFANRWTQAGCGWGETGFWGARVRGLLVPPKRSEYPRTTQSYHTLPVFQNRVKSYTATGPNQVWVGDLTYLRSDEGFMYLSLLTDRMSRHIVGYHCGDTLR